MIEEKEAERRKRVVRRNSVSSSSHEPSESEEWWDMDQVESFYRECAIGREDTPDPAISLALKHAASPDSRTVDLSGVQMTVSSAIILSDILTIEWGLRKLILKECNLDEHNLKPLLHALLIPNSLHFLSISSNRRLKVGAFKLIGAYLQKSTSLQFLDASQNSLDKKAIEYVASALATKPSLVSLRMDDCLLRASALETLAHAVRDSTLRNISLRYNRVSAAGAVALALMIKDYPDTIPSSNVLSPSTLSPPPTPRHVPAREISPQLPPSPLPKAGPILPPPRHPPKPATPTTYTPYIPRSRRNVIGPTSPMNNTIPIITSNSQGGITTARHPSTPQTPGFMPSTPTNHHGPSAALLDKVRALDTLPRLGALRTLDLKGNDIRAGITYIAQVLKRNRTLKVLNLSENKLDVQGLTAVAEALKYNTSLETLDMSKNPCCGPGLEGIQALRTAFTLNNALKRLFLSSTGMTPAGAICLAEFLPESNSLLHLDLTSNGLDLAGVMALNQGLKSNHVMRCLDLNIPPGDEEMARMCRDILNTCVRNTEEAEKATMGGNSDDTAPGRKTAVWGMIEESELAKTIRGGFEKPPTSIGEEDTLIAQVCQAISDLESLALSSPSASSEQQTIGDVNSGVTKRADDLQQKLQLLIEKSLGQEGTKVDELLALNDSLTNLLASPRGTLGSGVLPIVRKLPKDKGTGLTVNIPSHNGFLSPHTPPPTSTPNGRLHESPSATGEPDEELSTPRLDKGKQRAAEEPEKPAPVLRRPSLVLDSEDEAEPEVHPEAGISPTVDRSRSWVEEEGEVFRKGTVLLGPEEMEGEYAGEELRKELLEAMVERPPPRAVLDDPYTPPDEDDVAPIPLPPQVESPKPSPRPYVRRSRSSSSALNSPVVGETEVSGRLTPTSPIPTMLPSPIVRGSSEGST